MKIQSFIFLCLLSFCACQSDELVSPANSATIVSRSQQARPFTASLQSSVNPGSPLTDCSGDLPEFAIPDHFLAGQATHLGHLNAITSTLHHNDCNLSFATMLLTTSVTGQLTSASGDRIYYSGDDVINVFNLLTGVGTTGTITGTWNITGGTGKFVGASGSFVINGTVDFITGTFSAEANGTISY